MRDVTARVGDKRERPVITDGPFCIGFEPCAPHIGQLSNLFIEDLIRLFELEPLVAVQPLPARKATIPPELRVPPLAQPALKNIPNRY